MPTDLKMLALIVLILIVALAVLLLVLRRRSAGTAAQLRNVSKDYMTHFLIPDGQGGEIHIENALLCSRGIVIVDIKDFEGNIFGGDTMQDWTVIAGNKRFTFANPLPGLLDRTAAMAHLLPDVPISGYVAFTSRGKFAKGVPSKVIPLETLIRELGEEAKRTSEAMNSWWPSWEKLRAEAVVAQLAKLVDA
jgi:Nuclease-related domain